MNSQDREGGKEDRGDGSGLLGEGRYLARPKHRELLLDPLPLEWRGERDGTHHRTGYRPTGQARGIPDRADLKMRGAEEEQSAGLERRGRRVLRAERVALTKRELRKRRVYKEMRSSGLGLGDHQELQKERRVGVGFLGRWDMDQGRKSAGGGFGQHWRRSRSVGEKVQE